MLMSDHKGDKASNAPLSGSELQEVEPGAQALISGTPCEMAQATSIAQSLPIQ